MPVAAFLSFRFGPADGVSVEARKWAGAFAELGFTPRWVAGAGEGLDVRIPELAIDAHAEPSLGAVRAAIDGAAVVVVENLLSLPLNRGALRVVATALRGRPAIIHHHDLPWQRDRFRADPPPPSDPAWAHVTINDLSRRQLAGHGITAHTVYNRFRPPPPACARLDIGPRPVVLQPTRAIPRKNVPAAVALAEALGGTYWLLGPAEDGYEPEVAGVLARAACPVVREGAVAIDDAYASSDVVAFPSTWEGFGNPAIESALARRPLAIGRYPVARELEAFGFRWFGPDDATAIEAFLAAPDERMLDHNHALARTHFDLAGLPEMLRPVLERTLR